MYILFFSGSSYRLWQLINCEARISSQLRLNAAYAVELPLWQEELFCGVLEVGQVAAAGLAAGEVEELGGGLPSFR